MICDSLSRLDSVTTRLRGDSLIVVMRTSRLQQATISRLQGQANFARNSGKLSPEGVANVRQLGVDIRRVLRPGQMIAVQGHADDLEFGNTDIRNNLTLSSERAADAAHVLSSARHLVMIDPCQVIEMGYGSSRPLEPVLASDSDASKERKREVNRRIEFQIVDSPLTGTPCTR